MKELQDFLAESNTSEEKGLDTLVSYIREYIDEQWEPVLEQNHDDLVSMFDRVGEGAAYGTYAQKLFRPVQKEIKQAGFASEPGFPGTLTTSREWGPEERRERWMWSVISKEEGKPLGSLVVRFFHDHTALNIPSAPEITAIKETVDTEIVGALDALRRASNNH